MKHVDPEMVRKEAIYFVCHNSTIRGTAEHFHVSKSKIHRDLTICLPKINPYWYNEVWHVLHRNKQERHIRGGNATRYKWSKHL